LQTLKKQANQIAHIINSNTIFMNVIDDLPLPEFHYVTFVVGRPPYDCPQQERPHSVLLVPVWTLPLNENSTHHFYGFLRCFHGPHSPSASPLKTM